MHKHAISKYFIEKQMNNTQKLERRRWKAIKQIFKERLREERAIIHHHHHHQRAKKQRRDRSNNPVSDDSDELDKQLHELQKSQKLVKKKTFRQTLELKGFEMRQVQQDKELSFMESSSSCSEQQDSNCSSDDQKDEGNKKSMNERLKDFDGEKQNTTEMNNNDFAIEKQQKEQEEQLQKVLKAQEEERNKYILQRMDWDKNFSDRDQSLADDIGFNKSPSYMSEYEEAHLENVALVRCGKILWRSIIYGLYMGLVIIVVTKQIQSHKQYQVNSELHQLISNKEFNTLMIDPRTQTRAELSGGTQAYNESWLMDVISFDRIKNINDTLIFLKEIVPSFGKVENITTSMDPNFPDKKSTYAGYFIQDRKYLVGDCLHFSFRRFQKNRVFKHVQDKILGEDQRSKGRSQHLSRAGNGHLYKNMSQATEQPDLSKKDFKEVLKSHWFTKLLPVPESISSENFLGSKTTTCDDFTGLKSGFNYKCDPVDGTHDIYINMTLSAHEARLQRSKYGSQSVVDFKNLTYDQALQRMIDDQLFSNMIHTLTLEFITHEPFYDIHTLTKIEFGFLKDGNIITNAKTRSLRMEYFQTAEDIINLLLSAIYVVLYAYIFTQFIMQLRQRYESYQKWVHFEIKYLSEVEKKQRQQKKPEYIRTFNVIFNNFTLVNCGYSLLTLISIIKYIAFTMHCRNSIKTYPIWPNLSADSFDRANEERWAEIRLFFKDFQLLLDELRSYEYFVTLSILCATLKLFEYFDKSKNMHQLINVISYTFSDLLNFLIIFFCILFGFQALAHLSFGSLIGNFATFESSFR